LIRRLEIELVFDHQDGEPFMIVRTIIYYLFLGSMMMMHAGCSDDIASPPDDGIQAEYQVLKAAETFKGASVGFGGLTPESVHAFRTLLEHPHGNRYFELLLARATLPGQLYGLAGIYITDLQSLPAAAQPYVNSGAEVPVIFGCIGGNMPVRDLADRIIDGTLPAELQGT
jgi:hypothetical protein